MEIHPILSTCHVWPVMSQTGVLVQPSGGGLTQHQLRGS